MAVSNTFIQGDALTVLRTLPSESVQCCVTSPPYYGLRAYLPDGHPDKPLEIGLEETPVLYVQKLVEVFREVKRVLRNDGTVWCNLGDSYNTCAHWSVQNVKHTVTDGRHRSLTSGLRPKNLLGIPWRVAFALQDDGWILRSDIIWHKPNVMPESVTDRPTSAYEQVFLLAKSATYYYDSEAIKEPAVKGSANAGNRNYRPYAIGGRLQVGQSEQEREQGRNKRNVWTIPTQSFPSAHFATMPPKLVEPCILAGSRSGDIVLDPFSGAGTVALVAMQHGRKYIGIELNPEYITLAENRLDSARGLWETIA